MRRQGTKGTRVPNGGSPRLVLPPSSTTPNAFAYDANGNLTSLQRGPSAPFTFGYDALNRRTNEVWSTGRAIAKPDLSLFVTQYMADYV